MGRSSMEEAPFRFDGRTAVITGAAGAIGRATAVVFARQGARVVLIDRNEAGLLRTLSQVEAVGGLGRAVVGDLRDPEAIDRVATEVRAAVLAIDVLAHVAGIGWTGRLGERPLAAWDEVLAVNLRAPYRLTEALLPAFSDGSAVVMVASTRALMSEPHTEPYSAAKGGLVALTHALAITLGPRIRVNVVSPGWIDPADWADDPDPAARPSPEDHAWHPVGRVGRPEDVAYAILFLASREAGFITGAHLIVDGGMTRKMVYL
ncbi:MAG: SDR family oxidoreductase [Hydrogenibacillus schlegelii]|uniref:SDR family oxidoreductase n=1 Tax=Hydrogenibacillus schlegelii TaxID=1484 RepID=A0A947G8V5_HYDSH|nr:SDR family oxidoreductase [Hydrogenibacillus schlegelii]